MGQDVIRVLFIGYDDRYFSKLQQGLRKRFGESAYYFKQVYQNKTDYIKRLIIESYQFDPDIIYIDFTENEANHIRLAQYFSRTTPFREKALVGLTGEILNSGNHKKLFSTGVHIIHVKGVDYSTTGCMGLKLSALKGDFDMGYVTHPCNLASEAMVDIRIGYITPEYMHVESALRFMKGDVLRIATAFGPEFNPVSFRVASGRQEDLYYHFDASYDLEYEICYEPRCYGHFDLPPREVVWIPDPDKRVAEKNRKLYQTYFKEEQLQIRKEKKEEYKKALTKFINGYSGHNPPKRTRILIIDKGLEALKQSKKGIDEYNYTVTVQPYLDSGFSNLKRIKAGILAYVLEEDDEARTHDVNNLWRLKEMIEHIHQMERYHPFIIVLNCALSSVELQEKFNYPTIISDTQPFSFELVLQYAEVYETRQGRDKTHDPNLTNFGKEVRHYLSKNHEHSYSKLILEIKITEISEFSVKLICPARLPYKTLLWIHHPFPAYLSISGQEKDGSYTAIISGLSETQKGALRRFINKMIGDERAKKDRAITEN